MYQPQLVHINSVTSVTFYIYIIGCDVLIVTSHQKALTVSTVCANKMDFSPSCLRNK